jgi:hypothetical protein
MASSPAARQIDLLVELLAVKTKVPVGMRVTTHPPESG